MKNKSDSVLENEIEYLKVIISGIKYNNEERFVIAVLFDSGARAEEFHNIRREDIQLPSGSDNYVQITLKEEYSKTNGRTISLYSFYLFIESIGILFMYPSFHLIKILHHHHKALHSPLSPSPNQESLLDIDKH
jgi:hypothetical protein